ncbi:MAG: hypothetical protein LBE83_02835, partial [Propionibacteriaceae bacterium]|nr:hypothetical protein [Propionibacteriaceae bacterium]
RLLAHARRVSDQSELSSADRECNLAGSLVRTGGQGSRWVILVDDVVTTGASLREGVRALSASGPAPIGLATVAATILRGRNLEEVCGPDYLFFPGPANVKP